MLSWMEEIKTQELLSRVIFLMWTEKQSELGGRIVKNEAAQRQWPMALPSGPEAQSLWDTNLFFKPIPFLFLFLSS